jgi:uncharacterized protein YjiS (DUF1127 family)
MGKIVIITGASEAFAALTAAQHPANDDSKAEHGLLDLVRYRSRGRCDDAEPFTPLQCADLFENGAVMSIHSSRSRQTDTAQIQAILENASTPAKLLPSYRGVTTGARLRADVVIDNMSIANDNIVPPGRRGWGARAIGQVKRLVAYLERERKIALAVRQLARMSDRDLHDIGVERGGIEHVVRHGRDID